MAVYINEDSGITKSIYYRLYSDFTAADIPKFIRFKEIRLGYEGPHPNTRMRMMECSHYISSIEEKSQSILNCLKQLKSALNDSDMFLYLRIEENERTQFNSSFQFLQHLQNELLPICDSSLSYHFRIDFDKATNVGGNEIASILQMYQLNYCSKISISGVWRWTRNGWPIEVISNFLHRNCADINEKPKERYLCIHSQYEYVLGGGTSTVTQKLIDHLKEVLILILAFLAY